jgi:NH3-dependent NAD+ synthetase
MGTKLTADQALILTIEAQSKIKDQLDEMVRIMAKAGVRYAMTDIAPASEALIKEITEEYESRGFIVSKTIGGKIEINW